MLVCMAACHDDEATLVTAPMTAGAGPATTMAPQPSVAGAPAAAASGGSFAAPSPAGAPAAAVSGGSSATASAAGASAAAGSSGSSAAGAGMANTGGAGSSAGTAPAKGPPANPSAAPSCELPDTYTRAVRTSFDLTWSESIALLGGVGKAVFWAKVSYTRSSAGAPELAVRPCGLITPEARTTEVAGGLKAGFQVPFTAFDATEMLLDPITGTRGDDRSLTFAASAVVGAMLPDPDGEWPSSASLVSVDNDGDGLPGITALMLEGPGYAAAPTSLAQLETVDRAYIALRARLRVSITPVCSGVADGKVEPLGFNFSILGCHVKDRDACTASELRFIANGVPRFMPGASATWTEVELPRAASCADVRAALPAP